MENLVRFPGLNLEFHIPRVAIPAKIIGIDIYWYAICITLGIILAYFYCSYQGKKQGLEKDLFVDVLLYGIPSAVVGARLYYVVFNWDLYKNNPLKIFALRDGGIAIYGAVIFASLGVYIYLRKKKIDFKKVFDICAIGLLIGQITGRWGNFFNQEAFGTNTTLPWGMTSEAVVSYLKMLASDGVAVNPDIPVHPTFLYESLWNLVGAILLHIRLNKKKFDGEIFIMYVMWYGFGRMLIEGLRTDSLMLMGLRVSQLVGLLSFVAGLIIYILISKKNKLRNGESDE